MTMNREAWVTKKAIELQTEMVVSGYVARMMAEHAWNREHAK